MYVNHIVLLTKQISVLTREIKLENMNRRKGFPSVLAHLFILVFKLVLFFFFFLIGTSQRAAARWWRSIPADAPPAWLLLYSLQWQGNQPFVFQLVKMLNTRQFVIMENGSTLLILRAINWNDSALWANTINNLLRLFFLNGEFSTELQWRVAGWGGEHI